MQNGRTVVRRMIIIDPLFYCPGPRGCNYWSHMTSDTGDWDELHTFAKKIGLKRERFQGNHYDLMPKRRIAAVKLGAKEVTARELARALLEFRLAEEAKGERKQ